MSMFCCDMALEVSRLSMLQEGGGERIVLFTRPLSERRHDQGIDADALQQRFGLPVQRAE
jgi:hypothetical protein